MLVLGALGADGETIMGSDYDFSLGADVPAGHIASLLGSSYAVQE